MKAKNKLLFENILAEENRQYLIPVYQRTYTWKQKHCEQLYNDIISCIKDDRKHYLGSLVYSETTTTTNQETFTYCQIIDGQQRLTTIILLLKAIYDELSDQEIKLKNKISKVLYNKNSNEIYKLKLQSINNDNEELKNILLGKSSQKNALSNIVQNYEYFKERVKSSLAEGINFKMLIKGISNLEIVVIKLEDNDKPQLIYESINSTGEALDEAEKIRNFLLMDITNNMEQKKYYDQYWVELVGIIGNDNIQSFFYNYIIMKNDKYIYEKDLYNAFKTYCYSINDKEKIGKDILKYAKYYQLLLCNNSSEYSKETNSACEIFSVLQHNTIYPFLMRVCEDFSDIKQLYDKKVTLTKQEEKDLRKRETEFNDIINFFGNYAIRRNVCNINSGSLRRFYASLYNNVFKKETNKKNYFISIKTYICTLNIKDKFPSNENFKEHLIKENLYKNSKLLNKFFKIIENKGKEKIDWSNLSVEHILPQEPDKGWKIDLGDEFQDTYDNYLNTLGNLSITGYNPEYKNKVFLIKKQAMLEKKKEGLLKVFTLNEEILDPKVKKWNKKIIIKRAERLASLIVNNFSYPDQIDPSIEFDTYNEIYYDEDEKNFGIESDYKLIGFKLYNNKIKCKSYYELYKQFLIELYELNPNILLQMAESDWKPPFAKKIYISKKANKIDYSEKLDKDKEIYIETGINTYTILDLIIKILPIYNIDYNDFCLIYKNKNDF